VGVRQDSRLLSRNLSDKWRVSAEMIVVVMWACFGGDCTGLVASVTAIWRLPTDRRTSQVSHQREGWKKHRRERALQDIDELKDRIGALYELASSWKGFEQKKKHYLTAFQDDHTLLGRFHKYGSVAQAARDVLHWCMFVMDAERGAGGTRELKTQLNNKHKAFLCECENHLDSLLTVKDR